MWRREVDGRRRRVTNRELARELGVSPATISLWLHGDVVPTLDQADAVSIVVCRLTGGVHPTVAGIVDGCDGAHTIRWLGTPDRRTRSDVA